MPSNATSITPISGQKERWNCATNVGQIQMQIHGESGAVFSANQHPVDQPLSYADPWLRLCLSVRDLSNKLTDSRRGYLIPEVATLITAPRFEKNAAYMR
jgi:hypothetical protein